MWCFAASFATASVVGPGTGSAASYQRLSWLGQKYGPLKISCRQRIWTPFFPASSMSGTCLSNLACLTLETGTDSSLIGLLHWINPPISLRGIRCSSWTMGLRARTAARTPQAVKNRDERVAGIVPPMRAACTPVMVMRCPRMLVKTGLSAVEEPPHDAAGDRPEERGHDRAGVEVESQHRVPGVQSLDHRHTRRQADGGTDPGAERRGTFQLDLGGCRRGWLRHAGGLR